MKFKLFLGDCLERMQEIPDGSIDAVICDPPYGTTQCKWDSVIPFEPMWEQLHRVTKDNGAIVLFGSEPFSSHLRLSNLKNYKYDWVWVKSHPTGFLNAWKQPLRNIENINVFYKAQCLYNPQIVSKPTKNIRPLSDQTKKSSNYGSYKLGKEHRKLPSDKSMPTQIIKVNSAQKTVHPTQKPIALMEYLIKTYTNEGDTVLDFTMGSGTTGVACMNLKRNFVGIEKERKYYDITLERLQSDPLIFSTISLEEAL
jgi:site-specific DNA-methyltransferase (adenine-specific)